MNSPASQTSTKGRFPSFDTPAAKSLFLPSRTNSARQWIRNPVHGISSLSPSSSSASPLWKQEKLLLSPQEYTHLAEESIDYRCEDGRFPVSASCVTIANPDSLSSSETGVNPGTRCWRKFLSEWARCQKAIGGIYFTKKWRAKILQPGSKFDNFKPRLKSSTFKTSNASPSWTVRFFEGDDLGFLEEGVKTYLMEPMPVNNFFALTCIVHGIFR